MRIKIVWPCWKQGASVIKSGIPYIPYNSLFTLLGTHPTAMKTQVPQRPLCKSLQQLFLICQTGSIPNVHQVVEKSRAVCPRKGYIQQYTGKGHCDTQWRGWLVKSFCQVKKVKEGKMQRARYTTSFYCYDHLEKAKLQGKKSDRWLPGAAHWWQRNIWRMMEIFSTLIVIVVRS